MTSIVFTNFSSNELNHLLQIIVTFLQHLLRRTVTNSRKAYIHQKLINIHQRLIISLDLENVNVYKVYSRNLDSSLVVNTRTIDCSLKCGSLDQIELFNLIANAKYGESLGSDINDFARLSCCGEILFFKSTSCDSITLILANLSSDTPNFEQRISEYLSSSFNMNWCEYNSNEYFSDNFLVNEPFFNKENAMFVSTTNRIYNCLFSFSQIPFLASLPNSRQSSSVKVLFLVNLSSSSNSLIRLSRFINSSLADSDQLTQENSFICDFISSGTENVTDAIYNSPRCSNSLNFFNCSSLRTIIFLNTSDHLTSGCLSMIRFFNSSGMDNVTVAIVLPPNNYVDEQKYVNAYKYFGYEKRSINTT